MRRRAFQLLGDAQDKLRSDWRPGAGPTHEQVDPLREAKEHIAKAKPPSTRPHAVAPSDEPTLHVRPAGHLASGAQHCVLIGEPIEDCGHDPPDCHQGD